MWHQEHRNGYTPEELASAQLGEMLAALPREVRPEARLSNGLAVPAILQVEDQIGADLLVLASRGETYGMVATEALARGIPVVATAVQGLPESLGHDPAFAVPGILVPPGDPVALGEVLRRWLEDPDLRDRLRRSARARRTTLTSWAATARLVSEALWRVAAPEDAAR